LLFLLHRPVGPGQGQRSHKREAWRCLDGPGTYYIADNDEENENGTAATIVLS
jgi:hypothetical protein